MSHSAANTVTYRIAVAETVARAYRTALDNLGVAVALAWVPVIVMFAAELVAVWLEDGSGFGPPSANLLRGGTFLVFGSVFGVRWYRFVLIGERQTQSFFPPGFAGFLVVAIKFMLLFLVAAVLISVIVVVIALAISPALMAPPRLAIELLMSLFLALLVIRVSLVFPAAALKKPISFRAAWDLLAGNYWRFVVCATACYLPFAITHTIRDLGEAVPWPIAILCQAIEVIVIFAGSAVSAGMISDIYRNIVGVGRTGVATVPD